MKITKKYQEIVLITLAALLGAVATKYFITPLKLNLGGVYGLSILLTRIQESTLLAPFNFNLFGIMYVLFNIPLLIFGWFKLGKKLVLYTLYQVILIPIFLVILPESQLIGIFQEKITIVLIGGWLFGVAYSLTYKGNGSSGGLDIIAIYITKLKRNFSVSNINIIHTIILFVIAQIVYSQKFGTMLINEILIYSILFRFSATLATNSLFQRHKIILCTIITNQPTKLIAIIRKNFPHKSYSTYKVIGRSGNQQLAIDIVISYYESKDLLRIIKQQKINNFFYTSKVWKTHKNFKAIK